MYRRHGFESAHFVADAETAHWHYLFDCDDRLAAVTSRFRCHAGGHSPRIVRHWRSLCVSLFATSWRSIRRMDNSLAWCLPQWVAVLCQMSQALLDPLGLGRSAVG